MDVSMYKTFFLLLLVSFLNASVYDGVAIVVKDKAITLFDIKMRMQADNLTTKKASDILIREQLEAIEIKNRKISVSNSEVYDEIKRVASRNNLSVSKFYEAIMNTNGINSTELKAKIKRKIISQKLYSAIAYSSMEEPTQANIKEYFLLHKESFKHPTSFNVIIYQSKNKENLTKKITSPMFYLDDVQTHEQTLPYDKISQELANLLTKAGLGKFTPVIPDQKQGFMSFYVKEITAGEEPQLDALTNQIKNAIMSQQRESVLSDYFARLRQNTEIKTLRMPE